MSEDIIDRSASNKRIAKNTLLLYIRMILVIGVSLYTSRVVLETLGVIDYGIYSVVGGVVAMFSLFSGALSSAISRFITFELGRGNMQKLQKIFSSSIIIQLILSLIIVALIESVGVWFLNHKMNIEPSRMVAANWVLHLSALTLVVNMISVPYNALIIAHEKISAFAYISIAESLAKLLIAYMVVYSTSPDKLILYSMLMLGVALVVRIAYGVYSNRTFKECRFSFAVDRQIISEMFSFAGWNFIGVSSGILRDQGGNILLNLVAGSTVNAARAIAGQVGVAMAGFTSNFMTAINPQITKSYAAGDYKYMFSLIFTASRLSYYMLLLISLPLLFTTGYLLSIWLNVVPQYCVEFVQLVLLFGLCESISNPLITAMLATGDIRRYQLVVGGLQLLNLPISYIVLKLGCPPSSVLIVAISLSIVCLFARLIMLRSMIQLPCMKFIKDVILKTIYVTILCIPAPYIISSYVDQNNLIGALTIIIASALSCAIVIYVTGCTQQERSIIKKRLHINR
ncbi:MAG: lipopolysaccharide biosynthesis protein [Rikenellaceae bacterium]